MEFKTATMADFDVAFDYIEKLWDYNTYDKDVIRKVYADVLADENSFAFFLMDGDTYHGFCHGAYFNTFWLSGMTCYVSSIITNENERGKGCGVKLMDHAKELAKDIRAFLNTLPAREQDIFLRRYFFVEESGVIAQRYGMKPATVLRTLSRTRQKLKNYLTQEGYTV